MEGALRYFEPGLRPRLCFSKIHLGESMCEGQTEKRVKGTDSTPARLQR